MLHLLSWPLQFKFLSLKDIFLGSWCLHTSIFGRSWIPLLFIYFVTGTTIPMSSLGGVLKRFQKSENHIERNENACVSQTPHQTLWNQSIERKPSFPETWAVWGACRACLLGFRGSWPLTVDQGHLFVPSAWLGGLPMGKLLKTVFSWLSVIIYSCDCVQLLNAMDKRQPFSLQLSFRTVLETTLGS